MNNINKSIKSNLILYVDFDNIMSIAVKNNKIPDTKYIMETAKSIGNVIKARIYITISKYDVNIINFENQGYEVVSIVNYSKNSYNNMYKYIASDCMYDLHNLDINTVMIASNNNNFIKLIKKIKLGGKKVISFVNNKNNAKSICLNSDMFFEICK